MSDIPQPKQPPDQPKAPEQNAQGKPDSAEQPVDAGASKEAPPKADESLASPKPVPATPEQPAAQPADAGVKADTGDEDTAKAVKVPAPASQPAEAPVQELPKADAGAASAQPASATQDAPTQPSKPSTAPLDADKAATAQAAQPSSPPAAPAAPAKPASEPPSPAVVPDQPSVPVSPPPSVVAAPPATPEPPAPAPAAGQSAPVSDAEKPAAPVSPAAPETAASATSTAPLSPPDSAPAQPAAPPQPAAAMQQRCPNCGHRNRPGVLVCENCGTNLLTGKASVAGTRDLLREQEAQESGASTTASAKPGTAPLVDSAELKAVQSAGSGVFEDTMVLRIEIEGGATPILVYPKQEIIFGRRDPTSGGMPDVDLTPYAGYRMGVSRRHAAIRLQEKRLDVSDLGSSNGTFLNGTRLSAHRPYQLRDGDEIRLGQMVMRVFFQTNTGRKS